MAGPDQFLVFDMTRAQAWSGMEVVRLYERRQNPHKAARTAADRPPHTKPAERSSYYCQPCLAGSIRPGKSLERLNRFRVARTATARKILGWMRGPQKVGQLA